MLLLSTGNSALADMSLRGRLAYLRADLLQRYLDETNQELVWLMWESVISIIVVITTNNGDELHQQFPISRQTLLLGDMRESAFVNFLEQSHDGTSGVSRYLAIHWQLMQ